MSKGGDTTLVNLLFVRTDGVGDLVLTLPAAAAFKQQFPGIRLSYLVSRYAAPILEHHPDVDEILYDPGPGNPAERRSLLRNFEALVFFKPYSRWFWSAYRAGVRRRIGTGYRWYSLLLTDRVYEHRSRFDRHESTYNLNLLKPLGVSVESPKPPKLHLAPFEIDQADEILAGLTSPRVMVHPGNIYARNWKPERYFDLVIQLQQLGHSVILTGSEQERNAFMSRERETFLSDSNTLDLMGRLSLRQFMAVISRSDVVVSGSTGPMHLAAALETSTVSLFDPRRGSSPVRWGPLGERGIVLKPEVPTCEKCIYERCSYWDCMDRIPVGEVAKKVQNIFSREQIESH